VPIYEYACQKCGHELDALQKVSDPPLRKCPACGSLRLKRLVSAPQFRLKGTGWYETDFKGEKEKRRWLAEGDAPPPAGEATASTDGGEAAPAKAAQAESSPAPDKPAKPGKAGKAAKAARPAGAASTRKAAGSRAG